MKTIKVLIYGPKESGKTSVIRKTLYKDPVEQLKRIPPTVLIQHVRDYKHGDFNCSFFDCGGQLKFFDRYNDDLADNVFRSVTVFFYIVDSRLFFEEDMQNEREAGRKEQDALHIARQRYIKVAQREFWRAINNLYHYSGESLKLLALLAHKKDLPQALDAEQVKKAIVAKPDPELIPKINDIYPDVKDIVASMPAYATSIQDAPETTGLSSAEKVVFTYLDKLGQVMAGEIRGAKIQRDEIFGILQNANKRHGFAGSLLVNIEEPAFSVYACAEAEAEDIRGQVWQLATTTQGLLGRFGDKSPAQSVFVAGERYFVNLLRVNQENQLVVAFASQLQGLEQKFRDIYNTGEDLKKLLIKV